MGSNFDNGGYNNDNDDDDADVCRYNRRERWNGVGGGAVSAVR